MEFDVPKKLFGTVLTHMQDSIVEFIQPTRFKDKYTFEDREAEAARVLMKYPDRIPIIVEKDPRCKQLPEDKKKKFLVPGSMRMGEFLYTLRKRIKLGPEKAIFLFVQNSVLVPVSHDISTVYSKHRDPDGFLYVVVASEHTFG